jgi:hypothetical protein
VGAFPTITDNIPFQAREKKEIIMAKTKTAHAYELELRKMIKSRTGADMEMWLLPQVRATASNMVMIDKVQAELLESDLVQPVPGSMGQIKNEVSPLLPHYDNLQRTLLMQLEALGLNYSTTPSKVKEDTKKGMDDNDPLAQFYQNATKK